MKKVSWIIIPVAAFSLSACQLMNFVPEQVIEESYERVEDYCEYFGQDLEGRKEFMARLNSHRDEGGPQVMPMDCDGDGQPDFEL